MGHSLISARAEPLFGRQHRNRTMNSLVVNTDDSLAQGRLRIIVATIINILAVTLLTFAS